MARSRMPVSGSTLVAAQRTMRLTIFSRTSRPIANLLPEQIELVPGRPAGRHRDCRGSAADERRADDGLRRAATEARLMIETTLLATSEKLWPGACKHLRRAAQFVGMKAAKNCSIGGPAVGRPQVAARRLAAVGLDRQRVASRRRTGAQRASRSFLISIRKRVFGR